MAQDPAITSTAAIPTPPSPDIGKVDAPPPVVDAASSVGPEPDVQYWLQCMDDAERAERDWRKRGRDVVQIYRNEKNNVRSGRLQSAGIYFNILYSNTEVMLPAIYMKPPQPVVRSRFIKPAAPVAPPMPAPMPPLMGPPGMPGGGGQLGPPAPPGGPNLGGPPPGPLPPAPPGGLAPAPPPGVGALPPSGPLPVSIAPGGALVPPPAGMPSPGGPPQMGGLPGPSAGGPLPPPMGPPGPPPGPASFDTPLGPPQPDPEDVETAAAVMEAALQIVVDDEHSHEAVKAAIKDVLLPGRGVCRVRWKPQMKAMPLPGGPLPAAPGGEAIPPTEERKIWETVDDEYVFWEDFLADPTRTAADCRWVAFRHLFAREQLLEEFAGTSPGLAKLNDLGRIDQLLKWTDESAAKSPPGGGAPMKSARTLGDHVRKAMVWEIWDRVGRRIIWFCRDATGLVLRVDPDTLQLQGFFPCPIPMLAVTTSDSRIPRAFYDIYQRLAEDLDTVSVRISQLGDQIKVRGAYNATSTEIADILTAADGKMIPVDGVDMLNGGLANHIWLVPIQEWMGAFDKLSIARDLLKQQIYEVMGISDIMRGATRASETATAQRIKGSMGLTRLEDLKQQAGNFVRDLLRLKGEIIASNFDAATLSRMTGEDVTPAVMAILRDDFMRTCSIDIEADSTIAPDEAAEQQSMAMVMQSVGGVMQGIQGFLATGAAPPAMMLNFGFELIKMFLHPVPYSRGVVELIDQIQDQLTSMPPAMPPFAPPGMGGPPPGAVGPGAGPPPQKRPNGAMPGRPPTSAPPMAGGPPGPPMM